MSALDLLLFSSELVFRFLPIVTDTGIQIWNGVQVNEISSQDGFFYPDPLCCSINTNTSIYDLERQPSDVEYRREWRPETPLTSNQSNEYPDTFVNRTERPLLDFDDEYYDIPDYSEVPPDYTDGIRNRTRQSRALSQEDLISVTFNIRITIEGAISLGLVQLPGVCLGLFGVFRAFQRSGLSKQSVKDSLRSCLLFFLPFFIVELIEFVHFILSAGINLCCALVCSKVGEGMVNKFDLLPFLGNKDSTGKEKILALDAAKVFFGSVLQFCVQFYFIEISKEIRWSQCFSVVSSLLLITKTGYEIMSYTRDTREHQEELSFRQKSWQLLRTFGDFLTWLPLLGSNLVFKLGTINLCILFFGWYSILAILLIYLTNILSSFLATNTSIKNMFRGYELNHSSDPDNDDSAAKSPSILALLYTSYTNIFMISRTVATKSQANHSLAILLQPLHSIVAIIFIAVFKSWDFDFSVYTLVFNEENKFKFATENTPTIFLISGLFSVFLCFTITKCRIQRVWRRDLKLQEETAIKQTELLPQMTELLAVH